MNVTEMMLWMAVDGMSHGPHTHGKSAAAPTAFSTSEQEGASLPSGSSTSVHSKGPPGAGASDDHGSATDDLAVDDVSDVSALKRRTRMLRYVQDPRWLTFKDHGVERAFELVFADKARTVSNFHVYVYKSRYAPVQFLYGTTNFGG
jgi:hypothetical protein